MLNYLYALSGNTYSLVASSTDKEELLSKMVPLDEESSTGSDYYFISENVPYEDNCDLAGTLYYSFDVFSYSFMEVGHHVFPDFNGKLVHTLDTGDIPF